MKKLTVAATPENLEPVREFIVQELEQNGCPVGGLMEASIAAEEIYSNLIRRTARFRSNMAAVRCAVGRFPLQVMLEFLDNGVLSDTRRLRSEDSVISEEKRDTGNFSVIFADKEMDFVAYTFQDGIHVLMIQ